MNRKLIIGSILALLFITLLGFSRQIWAANGDTLLWVNPAAPNINIGETVTVTIQLDQATDVFGIELEMTYDPTIVQVVDADGGTNGVQISPGACPAPDFIIQNTAYNITGTLNYAVTQFTLPGCNGGSVAQVTLQGIANGISPFNFSASLIADTQGISITHTTQNGSIIVGPTPSPTITPTPTNTLTPTPTGSPSVTPTTPTTTATPTVTGSPTETPTPTATGSITATTTPPPSNTPTITLTPTPTIQDVFLPVIFKPVPPPTATPTPTITPSPTVTPTPTPSPTLPPASTGNIEIVHIQATVNEYVEIINNESFPIQLENWALRDAANHIYTFPNFIIQPGQVCRIYTNFNNPDYCGFNYESGSSIWNDDDDTAYLNDANGNLIDTYSY